MTRRRSFRHRPTYLPGGREKRRLFSMLLMLVLLGFMINHTSKPQTWTWLVENQAQGAGDDSIPAAKPENTNLTPVEEIIPNPTDEDAGEWEQAQEQFRNIRDKVAIQFEEMPAYWRLFKWARAQPMSEMEARALKNPFFTQFWSQPEKMRGKLATLRLQVRRILSHEAPENSAGVKRVYEIWGVTDESRGTPYVVITDQLPANLQEGADVRGVAVFTGYFLKILGYQTPEDKVRGAPLLIGKVRGIATLQPPIRDPEASRSQFWQTLLVGGIIVVLLVGARMLLKNRSEKGPLKAGGLGEEKSVDWMMKGEGPAAPDAKQESSSTPSKKQPPPFNFDFENESGPEQPPKAE